MNLQQIFNETDFVHESGTKEELHVAEYLKMQCGKAGVTARLLLLPFQFVTGTVSSLEICQ